VWSDSSGFAGRAYQSDFADSAKYSDSSMFADRADVAGVASLATTALKADTAIEALSADWSQYSDTATYSHESGLAYLSNSVSNNGVSAYAISGGQTAPAGSVLTKGVGNTLAWQTNPQYYTADVMIFTVAPGVIPSNVRYVVSRVASNYSIVAPSNPETNRLITIYNGATFNNVVINASTWGLDVGGNFTISPGQGKTLWYSGANWVIIN